MSSGIPESMKVSRLSWKIFFHLIPRLCRSYLSFFLYQSGWNSIHFFFLTNYTCQGLLKQLLIYRRNSLFLCNLSFYHRVHVIPPCYQCWVSLIQSINSKLIPVRVILIFLSQPSLLNCTIPWDFPTKILYHFVVRVPCHAHYKLLYLITLTILDKEYILRSSSLCIFFHSVVTSILLFSNYFLAGFISNTKCVIHSEWEAKFHIPSTMSEL
jgi:hypothetical protein